MYFWRVSKLIFFDVNVDYLAPLKSTLKIIQAHNFAFDCVWATQYHWFLWALLTLRAYFKVKNGSDGPPFFRQNFCEIHFSRQNCLKIHIRGYKWVNY